MDAARRITFRVLAIACFLLATATVLAALFAVSGSGGSPGLFLAVVLAGVGKWLWGKSQGLSARETFGRTIDVASGDGVSGAADGPKRRTRKP